MWWVGVAVTQMTRSKVNQVMCPRDVCDLLTNMLSANYKLN